MLDVPRPAGDHCITTFGPVLLIDKSYSEHHRHLIGRLNPTLSQADAELQATIHQILSQTHVRITGRRLYTSIL